MVQGSPGEAARGSRKEGLEASDHRENPVKVTQLTLALD